MPVNGARCSHKLMSSDDKACNNIRVLMHFFIQKVRTLKEKQGDFLAALRRIWLDNKKSLIIKAV